MNEITHGATAILNGLKYHAEKYSTLQDTLDRIDHMDQDQSSIIRTTINDMNNEAIAYFNRVGQFYYFARSQKIADIINDYEQYIPRILQLKIFRMKQSAHRATDNPRGENPNNMAQLDRLFTYQYMTLNKKLWFQVLLDDVDPITRRPCVNFFLQEDHPIVVSEIENFIRLLNNK